MEATPSRAQPTRLIGRESELASIRQRLLDDDVRLISLIGPAGVGKTRLALEVQCELVTAFSQGAPFIDLSPVRDPAGVTATIAESLGLTGARSDMLLERVQRHLASRTMLLILDNFEHVLPAASLVADLLASCPRIKILATSREPLRLRWENTVLIPPLAVPDPERLPEANVLALVPSVALLLHRIRARNAAFDPTDDDAHLIAELCVALDGLPLAIELAAARTPFLSLPAIVGRLQDRLQLLQWNAVDLPDRHRSLHAAVTWSYDLLSEQERRLFRALGVFAGDIALEAVESVVSQPGLDFNTLDGMLGLAERSLVQPDARPREGVRFRLLETVREYAWAELQRAEELADTRSRHAAYFLALAERAEPKLFGEGQRTWLLRLEDEHNNLRSALRWLGECGDAERQLRLANALGYFWWLRGYAAEGRRWLDEALEGATHASVHQRARGECWLATLLLALGELEQAETVLTHALAGARSASDQALTGLVLAGLGRLALLQGHAKASIEILEHSVETYADVEHCWGIASAKVSLGVAGLAAGEEDFAIRHLEESIASSRQNGDDRTGARATAVLIAVLARRGETERTVPMLRECIELSIEVEDRRLLHTCLEALVGLAEHRVSPDLMARLLGAEDALGQMTGSAKSLLATTYAAQSAEMLTDRLRANGFEPLFAEGQHMTARQIADLALQTLDAVDRGSERRASEHEAAIAATISLSRRENEVLALMATGRSDREIAQELFIAERTVRYHLTSIFNKLGADNRPQAVLLAARQGLL